MDNIDLNVHNYNFNEMLDLFKIKDIYDEATNKNKMDTTISVIRSTYPELYPFYLKSHKIINTLFQTLVNNTIDNKLYI